jgi:hypothetical protein
VLLVVVLLAAAALLWVRLRRPQGPLAASAAPARPLEEHAGRCATPPPPFTYPVPCPYLGLPAPPAGGIDYGDPFAGHAGVTCAAAGTLVMPTGGVVRVGKVSALCAPKQSTSAT